MLSSLYFHEVSDAPLNAEKSRQSKAPCFELQILIVRCNSCDPTKKWERENAFLTILDNNRWLSLAPDRSGHFQLGVNEHAVYQPFPPPHTQKSGMRPGLGFHRRTSREET